jgi:hypothetical protein
MLCEWFFQAYLKLSLENGYLQNGCYMSELLSPSLLAQVERSLRKRINYDVHSHLVRAAARVRTEQDFIAAAGRLLLNPKERESWILVWTARIQHRAAVLKNTPAHEETLSELSALDTAYHPEITVPADQRAQSL